MALVKIDNVNQATLNLHGASCLAELSENLAQIFTADAVAVFRAKVAALADGLTRDEALTTMKTLDGEIRQVIFRFFRTIFLATLD